MTSSHFIYLTLTGSEQRGSSAAPESPPGPNIYSLLHVLLQSASSKSRNHSFEIQKVAKQTGKVDFNYVFLVHKILIHNNNYYL